MDINAIRRIREAEQSEKFTLLMEEACGKGSSQRAGSVQQFQNALHQLESFRFAVSPGYYLTAISPDSSRKPSRKVIVTADEFDDVIKKEHSANCYAYSFLRDYLGLDGKEPLSPDQMAAKYPCTARQGGKVDYDFYDAIARILIKGAKRQVYGPGKKPF